MAKRTPAVRQAKRPVHRRETRVLALVGIAALALVAAGLSAFALFGDRDGSDRVAAPAPTVPSPTTVAPSPTATPEPTPTETPNVPVPQRILVAGDEPGNIMRATIGTCDAAPGTLEVTFDEGESWQPAAFGESSVTEFRQIDMTDPAALQLVAFDETCATLSLASFVGGTNWAPSDAAAPMFLTESPSATVVTPAGQVDLPCTAVSLSVSAARGIALCDDASVTMTQDSGATWSALTSVTGAVAVGLTPSDFVAASVDQGGCDGVSTQLVSSDAVGEPGGCITGAEDADGVVAVAGGTSSLFVWVGEQFAVSVDGGASWA